MFLKISLIWEEKTRTRVASSIKLQTSGIFWLKKRLWHKSFPVNFVKLLKTPLVAASGYKPYIPDKYHVKYFLSIKCLNLDKVVFALFNFIAISKIWCFLFKVLIDFYTKIFKWVCRVVFFQKVSILTRHLYVFLIIWIKQLLFYWNLSNFFFEFSQFVRSSCLFILSNELL